MEKGLQDKNLLVGNLNTVRTVMDVWNCVRAYYLLMMNNDLGKNIVFNVCGQEKHRMEYFTDKLISLSTITGIRKVVHKPYYRKHDIQHQYGNTTKLRDITGWTCHIPIDETLENLLNYWRKKLST